MTNVQVISEVLEALTGTRHVHADAVTRVPALPGLYAFYGDKRAWADLGLPPVTRDQPLYVGKAENSLVGRDVRTHFATGKTGSSTVRRSLASLLVEKLALVPTPRNLTHPDRSANFALDGPSEERLSSWMEERLSLSTWSTSSAIALSNIEAEVLRQLRPPLNLTHVRESREPLRAARRRMADEARAWSGTGGRAL